MPHKLRRNLFIKSVLCVTYITEKSCPIFRNFRFSVHIILKMFRANFEEVVVKCLAYKEEQVGVDPGVLEQFVHVLACAVDLRRQPSDAAPLPHQLRPDELPDVETVVFVLVVLCHCV